MKIFKKAIGVFIRIDKYGVRILINLWTISITCAILFLITANYPEAWISLIFGVICLVGGCIKENIDNN